MSEIIEKGKLLAGRGDYPAAIESFKKALVVDPCNETALLELGKAYYTVQEYEAAADPLSRLVAAHPRHRDALMLLGKTYREAGRKDDAFRVFETMSRQDLATVEMLREIGEFYCAEKKYGGAVTVYEKLLQAVPGDGDLLLKLMQLYNFEGKYDQALSRKQAAALASAAADEYCRNRLLNEIEIAERKTVLASKPRIMLVTLTNRCNLRCPMCGRGDNPWDISGKLRDEIISLLPYLELITWQGGEVFMYAPFKTILAETQKHKHLKQIIITNALLIDRGWAEALVGNGAVDLTISIDSVQKDTYEKLRRGARFEKLLESLDMLNEARTGTSSMKLTLRCAIMKSNYREIGAFIEFAREHRFDIVQIAPLTGDGDPENIFANKDREALEYLRTMRLAVRAQADEYGIKLLDWLPCEDDDAQKPSGVPADRRVPASCPEPEGDVAARSLCFRPWRQLAVNVRGEVFPECLCTRPVGTVFENSFIEIWNNEKMQRYRKNMINGDYAFCNSACSSGAVPPEHLKFIVG